jgi:hypothetical protein
MLGIQLQKNQISSTPPYIFMMWFSVNHRGNFTCFAAELIMCVAVFNLLDWGPLNYLAAALHNSVYLYATGENPMKLTTIAGGYCSALKWDSIGDKLVIGTNNSAIQVRILSQWISTAIKQIVFEFILQ